jgi:hypothetical protein
MPRVLPESLTEPVSNEPQREKEYDCRQKSCELHLATVAETALLRAIELNLNHADVRWAYSDVLMVMRRQGETMAQISVLWNWIRLTSRVEGFMPWYWRAGPVMTT